jgi:pimeloyl-ACP methyl ester carboxylesterase
MTQIALPVGFHPFHRKPVFNYQLNRWYSMGYLRYEDAEAVGRSVQDFPGWVKAFRDRAEQAFGDGELLRSAFCLRAAEFLADPNGEDRKSLYDQFLERFNRATAEGGYQRHQIPYRGAHLPAMDYPAAGDESRGTLVIHGGFDSFQEEFFSMAQFLTARGYRVITFDGPGQGGALNHADLPLTHKWEGPVGAVLDHFGLERAALMGISMGGYLCLRAAAFEPRIKQVIALSVVFDYMQIPPAGTRWLVRLFLASDRLLNSTARLKMRMSAQNRWAVKQMLRITRTDTPAEAVKTILAFNEANLHSDRVTQHVLLLSGARDHYIPLKMHRKQKRALTGAASVTERVYTRADHAENHCQVGNLGLMLGEVVDWLEHTDGHSD